MTSQTRPKVGGANTSPMIHPVKNASDGRQTGARRVHTHISVNKIPRSIEGLP